MKGCNSLAVVRKGGGAGMEDRNRGNSEKGMSVKEFRCMRYKGEWIDAAERDGEGDQKEGNAEKVDGSESEPQIQQNQATAGRRQKAEKMFIRR